MNVKQIVATVVVVAVLLSAGVPSAVAAASDSNDSLALAVGQSGETGGTTVTVTRNGTEVSNATVKVNATDGTSYAGEGTYRTDEDGTVTLEAPDHRVSVTVTATANGSTVSETGALVPLSDSLAVSAVRDDDGTPSVRVTQYGAPLPNATVTVTAAENGTYAGAGTYETNADGAVSLPEPDEMVTVNVTATTGNLTAETSVDLAPSTIDVRVEQGNDTARVTVTRVGIPVENATVNVTADGEYADAGEYETDESGTVELDAPERSVVVTVTAIDGNDEAMTTVTLERAGDPSANNFAQRLRAFLHLLRGNDVRGFGQQVSEFVHEHNPSNADDGRGPSDHAAGQRRHGNETAGNETATERGPPDHARGNGHGKRAQHGDNDDESPHDGPSENGGVKRKSRGHDER